MEQDLNEKSNETVNLGNVIPNVPPVEATISQPVNTVVTPVVEQVNLQPQVQTATVVTNVVPPVTNITTDNADTTTNNETQSRPEGVPVTENNSTKFIMNDKFIVNVEMLRKMFACAKKAAVCEPLKTDTTIFDITFDNEYLKVVATDGKNILIQTNRNVGFKDTLHINVAAELLTNLVGRLDCDTVEFVLKENRFIDIITPDGSVLSIPEFYDRESGLSITLEKEDCVQKANDEVIDIDGIAFKQLIQNAKVFCAAPKVIDYLSGMYCVKDKIYATDSENIVGLPNLPQLVNQTFYLDNDFIEILTGVDFGANSHIILRKDGDVVKYIIVSDDKMTLCGPCEIDYANKYPLSAVTQLLTANLATNIVVDKSKFENVLKIGELFIVANTDKECCQFTPNKSNSTLDVLSINKQATQHIPVTGLNTDVNPFNLKIKYCLSALNICQSSEINLEIDSENYKSVRFKDKDYTIVTAIQNLL